MEESPQPGDVLGGLQQQGTQQEQHPGGGDHHLGVEGEFLKAEFLAPHVQNHQEADAPEDDEAAGGQVQQHVALVGDQVPQAAQNVEARVVEGRDGVEHTDPQGLGQGEILGEHDEAEGGAHQLEPQGEEQHILYQAHHTFCPIHSQGFFHQHAAAHAHLFPGGQNQAHADGGNPQAAHLDEGRHHRLAEHGEVVRHVDGDKAGDAHGAGGGEQGVDKAHRGVVTHGDGQKQQPRAQEDHQGKAHDDEPARRLPFDG